MSEEIEETKWKAENLLSVFAIIKDIHSQWCMANKLLSGIQDSKPLHFKADFQLISMSFALSDKRHNLKVDNCTRTALCSLVQKLKKKFLIKILKIYTSISSLTLSSSSSNLKDVIVVNNFWYQSITSQWL